MPLDQAHPARLVDRRCPSLHAQLAVDGAEMVSYGVATEVEALRDLYIGQTLGDA